MRLGEALTSQSAISEEELSRMLSIQKASGGRLGDILIGEGVINAYVLAKALSLQMQKPFVDILEEDVDPSLLDDQARNDYLELTLIPWRKDNEVTLIATSEISPAHVQWAKKHYDNFDWVITSPYDVRAAIQKHLGTYLDKDAREELWNRQRHLSAKRIFLSDNAKHWFWFGACLALAAMFIGNNAFYLMILLQCFYSLTIISKTLFMVVGSRTCDGREASTLDVDEKHLPIYSILVPMFQEKPQTVEQIIQSIRALDYPKSRLDVKLIIEEGDEHTLDVVKSMKCERYFHIVDVPYSYPQTKPKACNYAFKFVKGQFVTIYDAEDRPDPAQLKKVLKAFWESGNKVGCVQARLNYYNRDENLLTKLFAIEYASWFMYMIPALEKLQIPIPLGGTSNHFRTDVLRELYAWDPYNVTEDADLGIRLAQSGYLTRTVNSHTLEEAPITVNAWIKQRSRWIKGYMQTYLVHMRQPYSFYSKVGIRGFVGFLFFVGAPSIVFITIPFSVLYWFYTVFYGTYLPGWYAALAIFNLWAAMMLHFLVAAWVLYKNQWTRMGYAAFCFPFYWLLHIIAGLRAVRELILRPHYWDKTEHGESAVTQESTI